MLHPRSMANKLFSSPSKKKKKKEKKTSFNFITTISQWSWVKNAQINSGSTSKECFNVANGCEFCVKEEEEEERKKERKERKIFFRRN